MSKPIKYLLGSLVVIATLVISFKVQKLDEYKALRMVTKFDSAEYALRVWNNEMPVAIEKAPDIGGLIELLSVDKEKVCRESGRKLGISKTWYFLTRGNGIVESVEDEHLWVNIGNKRIRLATSFIFGNAVRDASGLVDINDFVNMTDFNNVSVQLNNLVKDEIVPQLEHAKPGMEIEFAGAFEVNEENVGLDSVRVIPVSIVYSDGQ